MAANQSNQREKEIFERALDFDSAEERLGYVKGACADDAALLARVRALLQAHDEASRFLADAPGADLEKTLATHPSDDAAPGDRIGRYKLLQKIGEGGCGVVYMAEQSEPVRRRVALKVIKLGMDTKSVIARFESERQALALMDHPNIAKIFDAGTTEGRLSSRPEDGDRNVAAPISAGRPYFVMELVRGVRITEYCDEQGLSTRDRLDLFIKVCQAIQHAHQKGIIHRDIKPSNILVTLHDGVAVPKVIDFGIAKATADQRLTDKTLFTALEQFIGTPAYMSPEQAEMSGLDIDTRCDIYSLGVLLYEMLTGKTPFDAKELLASGIDAMRKTIREQEPVRPSTRLSTMLEGELTTTARQRQSEALKLIHLLRGDVDWIVMKCLEKDRARRYETANGLASDIQRHLNNEAVLARPASAAYRFQKLVRRNKLAFAAASAVTLTLIAGLSLSTWAFLSEAAQRRTAVRSAEQARQAEQKAELAAATITRNLYFAEMNLAGNAALEPGGISRVTDLTTKWLPAKGGTDQRGWEWYYLRSVLHQDLFTLSGHTDGVRSVAWSRDGKRLASGSSDHTIKIWDSASMQEIRTLRGHTNGVSSVAWSWDGKRLASGSVDNTIRIWDTATMQEIRTLQGHTNGVNSVAWNPDGTRLASGSDDKTVKIWDAANGTNILALQGHTTAVLSVAWSPDGKRLASASYYYRTIMVWDADSGQLIRTLTGHEAWVQSVSWSPDGKRLASAAADFSVKVWDADGGTIINTLEGHFDGVNSLAWSPDGKSLASGSDDNTIRVWDATSGRNTFTHRGHNSYVLSVAWSPDGKQLASSSDDKTIKVWAATNEETVTLRGHTNWVWWVAWSPDGKSLASASSDNTVKIWDPETGQESRTLRGHTNVVTSVAWSPDGKFLVSGSQDGTVKVWNVTSGRVTLTLPSRVGGIICAVSWSPDGKRLASGNGEHDTINLYDATSGQMTLALPGHNAQVHSVAWSPDGKFLASGSWDGTVRVWDAVSGEVIPIMPDPLARGGFSAVAWSRDGKRLAVGGFDKKVRVWDVGSGQLIQIMHGHSAALLSVSWSPDGTRLASASFGGAVKVWDTASGHEIVTLRGHTKAGQSVAWSPDGTRLASGSYDYTVKIWDARKGYALERE